MATKKKTCPTCNGSGKVIESQPQIGIAFEEQVEKTCLDCNGTGKIKEDEN